VTELDDSDVLYRHFIAVATGRYEDRRFAPLPVADEVDVLRGWLCGADLGHRAFTDERLAPQPDYDEVRAALVNPAWTESHAVAVYITGHGFEDAGHWIALGKTNKDEPASTALPTTTVVRWLAERGLDHLLVIADLCYAGAALGPLLDIKLKWRDGWLALASAGRWQTAGAGALAGALREFLASARLGKHGTDAYLSAPEFIGAINELLPADQHLVLLQSDFPTGQRLCLPNPGWNPGPDADPPIRPADLVAHWSPRARGVASDTEPGWFFTGRPRVMRRVLDFAAGGPGTLLVSGPAGSGKSALLSRLVALADERFVARHAAEVADIPAALRPPLGSVDAAVLATRKPPIDMLGQICAAVGARTPDGAASVPRVDELLDVWWTWLGEHERPVTVVVDSLDEADDPRAVIREVLARLDPPDGPRRVRLLVGVRSPGGETGDAAGTRAPSIADAAEALLGAERIHLDEEPYLDEGDVATYARDILTRSAESAYRSADSEVLDAVVGQIAEKAGRSYLFARAAATSLIKRGGLVDPDDREWLAALGDDVVGLVRDDVRRAFAMPNDREQAVHLLRAVAFGHGVGLPWFRVWAEVATAVAGDARFSDGDIAGLLSSPLSGYLATDREDGITVYRIADDSVRTALRDCRPLLIGGDAAPDRRSISEVEARITTALTPRREGTWAGDDVLVPEYVRRHLAEHAAAGHVLDRERVPDWFLPQVDPTRLRQADPTSTRLPLSPAVRRAAHRWDWGRPRFNAAALSMYSALYGTPLGEATFDADWTVPWAKPSGDASEILGIQPEVSTVAAAGSAEGRVVAVTGGPEGLCVWDLVGSWRSGQPVADVPARISALTVVGLPGGRLLALAAGDAASGGVWAVDLMSDQPHGWLVVADAGQVSALAAAELNPGRTVVATGDRLGRLNAWDLATGDLISASVERHSGPINAITAVVLEGDRSVWMATAGDDGTVRIWDPETGEAVGDPMTGHDGPVFAIAATQVEGRPVAVTGGRDETVRVWDLFEQTERGEPLRGHVGTVWSVSTVTLPDGRVCAVTCAEDPAVRVWDLAAHALHDDSMISRGRPAAALAAVRLPGADPVVVTAGRDDIVRLWTLTSHPVPDAGIATRTQDRISSLALGRQADGSAFAVTGSDADHATLWSLTADSVRYKSALFGHTQPVKAVDTAIHSNGKAIAVTASWDATLRLWDAADGTQLGDPLHGHKGPVLAVGAAATTEGRLLVVSGGLDGAVRFWDLEHSTSVARQHSSSSAGVISVTTTTLPDGRAVAVTGTRDGWLRAWDVEGREPLGNPVRAHGGGVRALATAVVHGQVVVVSGGDDGIVRVWDLTRMAPLGRRMVGHTGRVATIATGVLGADRPVSLSGGDDDAVRVWDLTAYAELSTELPTPTAVRALAVQDGQPELRVVMAGNGFFAVADRRQSNRRLR
jgi:WD40 repeat protein